MGAIVSIIYLAVVILVVVSMWKLYEKMGKPGWAAIVPIYNMVVLLEVVNKPIWWIILMCIPVVNIYVAFVIYSGIARGFGKEGIGYVIGILLLPIIFIPMLAFGDNQFNAEAAVAA